MAAAKTIEKAKEKAMKTADKAVDKVTEVAEAAPAEIKEVAKKVTKKVASKKPAKKELKPEIILQYGEKEIDTKDVIAAVKKEWTKSKNKVADIKSMKLYMKPQDYAVYYVINDEFTGKIWM